MELIRLEAPSAAPDEGGILQSILRLSGPELNKLVEKVIDFVWANSIAQQAVMAVLVAGLIYIGRKVAAASPQVRKNCLRLSIAIFLLVFGYEYFFHIGAETFTAREYLPVTFLKSFNAGGLVLGVTWIVLPVLSFVLNHFRLALASFLCYAGYAVYNTADFTDINYADHAVHASIVVAVTLVVAWIVHPIWDYIHDLLPKPKPREERTEEERPRRPELAPQPVAAAVPLPAPLPSPPPVPAPAPPPDVLVPQLELVSGPATDESRRRDRIRLQIEMAYIMAAPQLGMRLPREAFNDLLSRYLGEHLPIEDVEENSRQLMLILQEHQKQAQSAAPAAPPALTSVAVLAPTPAPAVAPTAAALEVLLRRILEEQRQVGVVETETRFKNGEAGENGAGNHTASNGDVLQN